MRYPTALLRADILDELDGLARLYQERAKIAGMIELLPEVVSYYDRGAVG